MQKQAILFDIDGTLVDSNDAHVEAWWRAFAAAGFDISRPAIHEQIGKGADNLLPSLLPDSPGDVRDRLARAHGDIYKGEYLPRVQRFPGAREILLKAVAAGQKVVLASSASREELDHYVQLLQAGDLLSATTSKDDVEHSKPCPDIFAEALERTRHSAEQAIVIGDTPYDIAAARHAGLDAIAVLSGGFSEETLRASGPVAVYANVEEIIARYESSPLGTSRSEASSR
jgi:membrane protein